MATFVHVAVPVAEWRDVAAILAAHPAARVAVCFTPGTTPILLAAATGAGDRVAPWLEVTDDYPAAMAARDLVTLAHLTDVTDVVVSAGSGDPLAHAALFAALLDGDDVTLRNAAGSLNHAYNRPPPPRPIAVWVAEGPPTADAVRVGRFTGPGEPVALEEISRRIT